MLISDDSFKKFNGFEAQIVANTKIVSIRSTVRYIGIMFASHDFSFPSHSRFYKNSAFHGIADIISVCTCYHTFKAFLRIFPIGHVRLLADRAKDSDRCLQICHSSTELVEGKTHFAHAKPLCQLYSTDVEFFLMTHAIAINVYRCESLNVRCILRCVAVY